MIGELVRDRFGRIHEVLWRHGNTIRTVDGEYIHVEKCSEEPQVRVLEEKPADGRRGWQAPA